MIWLNQSRDERDAIIRQRIASGQFEVTWLPVTSSAKGHTGVFQVMADALKMDGVRINVSATLEQQIADRLGASLQTPKLCDLRFMQRNTTLLPMPRPIALDTKSMIDQSLKLDAAIAKQGGARGIIATVGKDWVISNQLAKYPNGNKAENFGWHFVGDSFGGQKWESAVTPPLRVIQGQGWAHDPSHVDYSQVCVLVKRECTVDGVTRDIRDVMQDPELSWLVSHDGRMSITRQPGVPEETPNQGPANISGSDPFLMVRRVGESDKRVGLIAGAIGGALVGGTIGGIPGAVVGLVVGGLLGQELQSSL